MTDDLEVPHKPNESGATSCIVRWMVEIDGEWLGAYNKEAFDYYKAKVCAQAERREQALVEAFTVNMIRAFPSKSHEEIQAEIARILNTSN